MNTLLFITTANIHRGKYILKMQLLPEKQKIYWKKKENFMFLNYITW